MNFLDIKTLDIANGPGCRISLFVSGCRRHCKECFNPESWDFTNGEEFTEETASKIIDLLRSKHIKGFSVLGGEPFEMENQLVLHPFLRHIRKEFPNKSIWMYTGFTIEELYLMGDITRNILSYIDVLVDGEFQIDKKDIRLQWCGSKNQRVINIPDTLITGNIITYDRYDWEKGQSANGVLPIFTILDRKEKVIDMDREIKIGRTYRHFKGNFYKVLCLAIDSETGEKVVVHQRRGELDSIWTRPLDMFMSEVDREKYPNACQKYRFELCSTISTNHDNDKVRELKKLIHDNGGYCISRDEKNKDTECMCKEFREMSEGTCRCGLYYKA